MTEENITKDPIIWSSVARQIKDLKEYSTNPRKISKKDFDLLVKSLKEDGYHSRIKINTDNTIIGGHQRKKALLAAGFKEHDTIEVLMPNQYLTEQDFKRLNIRDNLVFGEFDIDMLANNFDVGELKDWGFPDNLLDGFEESFADNLNADTNSEEITPKAGDVWLLGNHRLICADSMYINDLIKFWEKLTGHKAILENSTWQEKT